MKLTTQIIVRTCLSCSIFLLLTPMITPQAGATLITEEILAVDDHVPNADQTVETPLNLETAETPLDLGQASSWEDKFMGDTLSNPTLRERSFQIQNNPRLRLKSPGKLPGIEFGVELHSFQAFQSVVPSESLTKGLDLKQEQPLLLPPSVNVPDYNGGFLRFTW